jgi:hypothetical protein
MTSRDVRSAGAGGPQTRDCVAQLDLGIEILPELRRAHVERAIREHGGEIVEMVRAQETGGRRQQSLGRDARGGRELENREARDQVDVLHLRPASRRA